MELLPNDKRANLVGINFCGGLGSFVIGLGLVINKMIMSD